MVLRYQNMGKKGMGSSFLNIFFVENIPQFSKEMNI